MAAFPFASPSIRAASPPSAPDGNQIAYNRIFRNFRTWKRYTGGMAQRISIYDFKTNHYEQLNQRLPRHRHLPDVARRHHLFRLRPWPRTAHESLQLQLPTRKSASSRISRISTSTGPASAPIPSSSRMAATLCIDLGAATKPAKSPSPARRSRSGAPALDQCQQVDSTPSISRLRQARRLQRPRRCLHRSRKGWRHSQPHPHLRHRASNIAAWSPDGKWIAYLSDRTGEDEIYIRPQDGARGSPHHHRWFLHRLQPLWSPDSKKLLYRR